MTACASVGVAERPTARRRMIGSIAAILTLAACDPPETASDASPGSTEAAFAYAARSDLSGYYRPVADVRVGRWSLRHIFIGQPGAFERRTGVEPNNSFSPVHLQFVAAGEQPATGGSGPRVLPVRYRVTDTHLSFVGRSPELGEVAFEGRLDPEALAMARRNLGDDGVVVTGSLTAAGDTLRNVRLTWSMGD